MSIEFYCPHCEAYLRAPDSKARLSIACPHCGGRCWVPLKSEQESSFDDVEEWSDAEDFDEADYEADYEPTSASTNVPVLTPKKKQLQTSCKVCDSVLSPSENVCKVCSHRVGTPIFDEPADVDVGKILSTSWRLYTRHFGTCLIVTVTDAVLTIVACVLAIFIGGTAALAVGNRPGLVVFMFLIASGLGWGIAMSMFAIGHMRFYLDLCRTDRADFHKSMDFQGPIGHIFSGGVVYWSLFPFLLPPIFLWPFGRVVVDQNVSGFRGLWTALRLSVKHFSVCFVLVFVKIGAILISSLFPVGGAILLTPYFAILNTVAYLHFIGELE